MIRHYLHFLKVPDEDVLQTIFAGLFAVRRDDVFVYSDAFTVFGSADRAADPTLDAAYGASSVRVLLQFYQPNSGPIAGWLCVEAQTPVSNHVLARALATATVSPFYYDDPTPDPNAGPSNEGAQIEVGPEGHERPVWLVEYGGPKGATLTDLSDRETH